MQIGGPFNNEIIHILNIIKGGFNMNESDGGRIFKLNLQLSMETLRAATPEIEALGLDPKEFFVLDGLEGQPYPAELARHLSMPKATITLHLKSFEDRGLMVRAIDSNDRRKHRLELTETGHDTILKAREILSRRYTEQLRRLSHCEQSQFLTLLEKICN